MSSGSNGRRGRLWLPPGAEIHPSDLHDVVTLREWLEKPATPTTRAEVAAFCEAVIQDQVRQVCQFVVDRNNVKIERFVERAIVAAIDGALEEQRAARWYRRLGRWIATFGHRPVIHLKEMDATFPISEEVMAGAAADQAAPDQAAQKGPLP